MARPPLSLIRVVFAATLSALLLSCSADDPIDIPTTRQADEDAAAPEAGETDAVFPPVAEGVDRPTEIVDLRGNAMVEIEIRDNSFEERFFQVDPGTEIVFVNRGANPHNVVPAADGAFGRIEQDALSSGAQALILDAPGDYPFYCAIHGTPTRGQTGYVVVGAG